MEAVKTVMGKCKVLLCLSLPNCQSQQMIACNGVFLLGQWVWETLTWFYLFLGDSPSLLSPAGFFLLHPLAHVQEDIFRDKTRVSIPFCKVLHQVKVL